MTFRSLRVWPAILLLVAGAVVAGSGTTGARALYANGGALRLGEVPVGDYLVSVFTDPTPVRPAQVDVSVLVVRPGLVGVAEGVDVRIRARPTRTGSVPTEYTATREQADDPRYYVARFELDEEGPWEFEVLLDGEHGAGTVSFQVAARERGWLSHPLLVGLLALLPLGALAYWAFSEPERIS